MTQALSIPLNPPTPSIRRLDPAAWWHREGWPDPNWKTGLNFTLYIYGENFIDGESVLLLGSQVLPAGCSRNGRELTAEIKPPDKPGTFPVRIRTGMIVSNALPLTFTDNPSAVCRAVERETIDVERLGTLMSYELHEYQHDAHLAALYSLDRAIALLDADAPIDRVRERIREAHDRVNQLTEAPFAPRVRGPSNREDAS